jgi:hypothetical protein
MISPLVEFDPPDSDEQTITWSRALVAFAEEIQRSAPDVLVDLNENVFQTHRDVLPVHDSTFEEIEAYLVSLLLKEFDRRYPIKLVLTCQPEIRVQERVLKHLLMSGIGFSHSDPRFPDLLAAMKQEDAEKDFQQNPAGYDPRCRLLIDSNGTYWGYLTAVANDCHPELIASCKAISVWADKWHLCARPGFRDWFCSIALRTMSVWSREGFDGEFWYSGPRHKGRGHIFTNEAEETAALPLPVSLSGFPRYRPHWQTRDYYLTYMFGEWLDNKRNKDWFQDLSRRVQTAVIDDYTTRATLYCDRVDAYYKSRAWKHAKDRREFNKHLNWTVRFQVLEQDYPDIASQFRVGPATIRSAVNQILDLLGLVARERVSKPKGRHKGTRNSKDCPRSRLAQRRQPNGSANRSYH